MCVCVVIEVVVLIFDVIFRDVRFWILVLIFDGRCVCDIVIILCVCGVVFGYGDDKIIFFVNLN